MLALVCIARNEDRYIQEWIEYHLALGFTDIFIYMNDWRMNYPDPRVHLYEADGHLMQLTAYNRFIQENEYEWAAFLDCDEFLVLKKHTNLRDFLSDYDHSLGINWVLFGDSGLESHEKGVLDSFTWRQKSVNMHIKTILKEKSVFYNPHCPECIVYSPEGKPIDRPFNMEGTDNIAQINHYHTKTRAEYAERISRGRVDVADFRPMSDFYRHNFNEIEEICRYPV